MSPPAAAAPEPAREGAVAPGEAGPLEARHVRSVRLGHGANCSSIGSVVDTLFATGVLGVAIFAMIAAAMRSESVTVVGRPAKDVAKAPPGPSASA